MRQLVTVQNVCQSSVCAALLIPDKSLQPMNHFKLLLLMEAMPLETRHGVFILHDEVTPCFDSQVLACSNQHYENCWIGHHGPVSWPLKTLDLT